MAVGDGVYFVYSTVHPLHPPSSNNLKLRRMLSAIKTVWDSQIPNPVSVLHWLSIHRSQSSASSVLPYCRHRQQHCTAVYEHRAQCFNGNKKPVQNRGLAKADEPKSDSKQGRKRHAGCPHAYANALWLDCPREHVCRMRKTNTDSMPLVHC